jgi:putative transposase
LLAGYVFVERLWKSIKYEEVYLKAYDGVPDAKTNLAAYLRFYNRASQHPSVYVIEKEPPLASEG